MSTTRQNVLCGRCGRPTTRGGAINDGLCSHCVSALEPAKHPKLRDSLAKLRPHSSYHEQQTRALGAVSTKGRVLGYSNAMAAGDMVMRELERRLDHEAQHGPVRIYKRDGKQCDGNPVSAEVQDRPRGARRRRFGFRCALWGAVDVLRNQERWASKLHEADHYYRVVKGYREMLDRTLVQYGKAALNAEVEYFGLAIQECDKLLLLCNRMRLLAHARKGMAQTG